ncbi:MAG: two-component system response regulator [Bacilli bacterium]
MRKQSNSKLLVVDDRRENLLAMESVFENSSFELVSVMSGEMALRYLLNDQCSVIIMDVQMPGMNGFETVQFIKSREKTRNIPIIFVTAIDRDIEHVLNGYRVGGVDYVSKPFDPRVLMMKVERLAEEYDLNEQLKLQTNTLRKQSHELMEANSKLSKLTEELHKSEALARLISHTSMDAIITLSDTGNIIDVNPATSRMYARESGELVGQHIGILLPETLTPGNQNWRESLRVGEVTEKKVISGEIEFPAEVQLGQGMVDDKQFFACTIRNISDRKHYIDELKFQAFHDALTGLPNRTYLYDVLTIIFGQDDPGAFSLFLFDIDHFKNVNDTLGHANGDRLLKLIAKELLRVFGESMTAIVRLGGDEFAIVSPLDPEQSIEFIIEEIEAVMQMPFDVDGHQLRVSSSTGVARFPEHGRDVDTLLQRADIAMYVAKRNKTSHAEYSDAHNEFSIRKLTLISDLKTRENMDHFLVYYQPKMDLESGGIIGIEALMRWKHPEYGLVLPGEFIPLIEESGRIGQFSSWVLRESVRKLHELRIKGINLGIAVNLSARDLLDRRLPEYISNLVMEYGIPPQRLTLELTEGSVMSDTSYAVGVLNELSNLGIRISVDDFGTGYSSLAYLGKLPVHELKIDKGFVMNMEEGSDEELIVKSITSLAHSLQLDVVAEGVENVDVLNRLKTFGVNSVQGYYISRPLPPDALEPFLTQHMGTGSVRSE